jgi:ABC-type multidrug transport system fused ATPase/permease subunit
MSYFDTNPKGRMLARFSRDIELIDHNLPRQIDGVVFFLLQVKFPTHSSPHRVGEGVFGQMFALLSSSHSESVLRFVLTTTIFCVHNYLLALMSTSVDTLPKLWCLRAAVKLHNIMLRRILGCPLDFYDRTPVGRLLSRFSSDVFMLDSVLPMVLYSLTFCFFSVNFLRLTFCTP